MILIFSDMVEETLKVFMDDFSMASRALQRCKEFNLVLNWEKYHFIVNEGIVLGYKIFAKGIEIDKAKVELIEKLPPYLSQRGMYLSRSYRVLPQIHKGLLKDCKPSFQTFGEGG